VIKVSGNLKKIFNYHGFRRYFASTSWLLADRVLRIILGLFVGVYVARYLGPEKFGVYSYAIAFVTIFSVISTLGLEQITVRDLVRYPERKNLYLGTVFWLKFVGSILTLGIIIFVVQFTSNSIITNIYIFIIASGLLFQSFEVVDFYFRSKVLSKYVSICKIIQLTLSSLLKLYFIFIKADLLWFVIVIFIDYVSLAISYTIVYKVRNIGMFFRYFNLSIAKEMLKNSWPLILSGIMIMIYMRIDQVMIREMLSDKDVGLYSAVVKLSEAWYFIPVIITSSLFPAIINAKRKSEELYYKRFQQLYDLILWMAIIVALPITFFSKQIIVLLYGLEFKEAANVLSVHIWQGIFVGLGVASSKWLISENLQIVGALNTIVGALVNVVLNLVLIPRMGIMGAAISTIISYSLSVFFFLIFYKKARRNLYLLFNTFNPLRLFLSIKN